MRATRSVRPVKHPARAVRATGVKHKTAKASAKKKIPEKTAAHKKTSTKKSVAKKPAKSPGRLSADKQRASVAARKATMAATTRHLGDTDPVIDAHDEVAQRKLARLRRTAVDRLNDPAPAAGTALIDRVMRAVERELIQIETIVGGHRVDPKRRTEAERRARTLASLARTLTEVRRLRAADEGQRPHDDAAAPRDLDDFRRTLSQRLEGMVGRATPLPAGGDDRS